MSVSASLAYSGGEPFSDNFLFSVPWVGCGVYASEAALSRWWPRVRGSQMKETKV